MCGCPCTCICMHVHFCVCVWKWWWHHLHAMFYTRARAHTQKHTPLFGPAQRHTHFKGVWFGSNAVGAGRWWMYTTLSMALLPSSIALFMSVLAGDNSRYNTWILMWINELKSIETVVQINQMLEPECKAILDHVPLVIKIIWFQGSRWIKCAKALWTFRTDCISN